MTGRELDDAPIHLMGNWNRRFRNQASRLQTKIALRAGRPLATRPIQSLCIRLQDERTLEPSGANLQSFTSLIDTYRTLFLSKPNSYSSAIV